MIILQFPGIGKTWFYEKNKRTKNIVDSDSSKFAKDKSWPEDYIHHLEMNNSMGKITLGSTHAEVRKGLHDRDIQYEIIMPEANSKTEFINRYKKRGSSKEFCQTLEKNWNTWMVTFPWEKPVRTKDYLETVVKDLIKD